MDSPAIPHEEAASIASHPPVQPPFLEDGFPNPRAASDIWDFMANHVKAEHWSQLMGYLYRIEPAQMRIEGIPAYLLKFQEPLTIEMVKAKFGGRIFKIMLNRRVGGRESALFSVPFPIEAEPILATGERWAPQPNGNNTNTSGGGQSGQLLEHLVLDAIRQRDDALKAGKGFDVVSHVNQAVASASTIQQTAFISSIQAMKETLTRPPAEEGGGLLKIFLSKAAERMFAEPIDPMVAMMRNAESFGKLKELWGGGSPAGTSENVAMVGEIMKALPAVIEPLTNIARDVRDSIYASRGITPQIAPAPVPSNTSAASAPVSETLHPQAVFTPGATLSSNTSPSNTSDAPASSGHAKEHQFLVTLFLRGEPGEGAAYVFHQVAPEYSEQFVQQLKENGQAIAAMPEFQPIVADPRLPVFLRQFIGWYDQPEESAPAAAASVASTPKSKRRAA